MTMPSMLADDWFAAPLPSNVDIGDGSWLYSAFAFLHFRSRRRPALRIGRACGIYNGSFFALGPRGQVCIGDHCTLVGVVFSGNVRVTIGDCCFLAHEVVIGDAAFAVPGDAAPACAGDPPPIEIGDDVWIGASAVLLPGARIGDGAIIGAAAVVDFEVPHHGIVAGNPARLVGHAPDQPAAQGPPA